MSKQAIERYLSSHKFFSGLDDASMKFLLNSVTELQVKEGEVLFQQGKPADKFYLLREGQVCIQVPAIMGPTLDIQTLGKDEILGWSWLIAPYRWHFQARAQEDSNLLEFDGKSILVHCEEDPGFGYELLKRFAALMSERLDAARQNMMDQWNPPGFA
ncbi:MAG: cyclic nucleotide-binding domain-containing protein [Gammaproteobacteria bacterium]|nr:cyclic nucleotide-binding domain-containing protein [Gammaproteobacteria bacterium]MDH3537850.1 cyclic nucleotide-binding domain-containing protein [Gammaproteobacteria bacterium]